MVALFFSTKKHYFFPGIESILNSDDSSSGWENSDSAVESSDDEDEETEAVKMEEEEEDKEEEGDSEESEDSDGEGGDSESESNKSFKGLGIFGPDGMWLGN